MFLSNIVHRHSHHKSGVELVQIIDIECSTVFDACVIFFRLLLFLRHNVDSSTFRAIRVWCIVNLCPFPVISSIYPKVDFFFSLLV